MTGAWRHVRRADPADAPDLARVEVRSWQSAYRESFPEGFLAAVAPDARLEWWERTVRAPDLLTLVVEVGGVPAGYCLLSASRERTGTGEVVALYLDPCVWRHGHGRRLIEEAIAELRAAGCSDAVVWVLDGNRRARLFYEAVGFVPDGEARPAPAFGPGAAEVRYRMTL